MAVRRAGRGVSEKIDHIADFPVRKPPRRRPRASAPAAFGAGAAAGGVAQWAGAATAAWLESAYWHGIHASPYGGRAWRALRFLGRRVLGGAIRLAVSTLGCFNHRVSAVQANVKFQRPPPDEDDSSEEEEEDDGRRPIVAAEKKRKRGRRFRGANNPASGKLASSSPLDALSTASDGLATVVGRIKALGVDRVYCWHALFGYWGGLHPKMPGVRKFGPPVLKTPTHTPGVYAVEPSQAWDPITLGGVGVVPSASLARFYAELHAYLAAAGVDGIKVDGQAVVGGLGAGVGGGPALARETHAALERSVETYFPENGLINCMCHSSENILNFSESNLARVSDDFYPTNGASHTVHVANVAYNSAFMGEIVVPDWDMFQSHCGEAGRARRREGRGGVPRVRLRRPGKTRPRPLIPARVRLGENPEGARTGAADAGLPLQGRVQGRGHRAQGVERERVLGGRRVLQPPGRALEQGEGRLRQKPGRRRDGGRAGETRGHRAVSRG